MLRKATKQLAQADSVLAEIIRRIGPYQMASLPPTFETLARSITFQQLHGRAALVIFERLKVAVGKRFSAAAFLRLDVEQLRACGLSRQKTACLRDLAERVQRREINFRRFPTMLDEDIVSKLCEVRGIGVWTAQMFLMSALERPNVMPLGDLGIRSAVRKAYHLDKLPKPPELARMALKWHPYCSLACWYLWRSLDKAAAIA